MNLPTLPHSFSAATAAGNCLGSKPWASQRGSALLAALCFTTVLAVSMGSYIALCYRTLELSSRSLQSTRSLELAETGMEDALWAINNNNWSGWTTSGTTATKTLTGISYDNNVTGDFQVTITNYNGSAGIRSVTVTGTTHQPNGADVSRTLTATSSQTPLFVNAIAATTSTVVFSSGGTVDSYNSSLGTYASQTPTFSAVVASAAPNPSSATVQLINAQIKGYAASLHSGGPSYSTSARVYGPLTPTATKVDSDRISMSPYQPVFPIKTISAAGTTLAHPAANSTTTIGRATDTVPQIYYSTGLDLLGTTKIIVDGPVRLVVSGALYVGLCCDTPSSCVACSTGMPSIEVTSNGTLELFVSGDIAIRGNGIKNLTLDPQRLALYGTNALAVPDMLTATPYYGVTYTPTGNFTVKGDSIIYGAIVAKKVSLTGTAPAIHYDLNLRNATFAGVEAPYGILNWNETTAP